MLAVKHTQSASLLPFTALSVLELLGRGGRLPSLQYQEHARRSHFALCRYFEQFFHFPQRTEPVAFGNGAAATALGISLSLEHWFTKTSFLQSLQQQQQQT